MSAGPFPNPFDSPASIADASLTSAESDLAAAIADCTSLVSELKGRISEDISACLNSCHGDKGLCTACVLGAIDSDIEKAGVELLRCGSKISDQVATAVKDAWEAAAVLGISPVTPEDVQAVLAGGHLPELQAQIDQHLANAVAPSTLADNTVNASATTAAANNTDAMPVAGGVLGGNNNCPPLNDQNAKGQAQSTDFALCPDTYECLQDGSVRHTHYVRVDRPGCPPGCLASTVDYITGDAAAAFRAAGGCVTNVPIPPTGGGGETPIVGTGGGGTPCPPCPPAPPVKPPDVNLPPSGLSGICSATDFSWYTTFQEVSGASFGQIAELGGLAAGVQPSDSNFSTFLDAFQRPVEFFKNVLFGISNAVFTTFGVTGTNSIEAFVDPLCDTPERRMADNALSFTSFLQKWFGVYPERVTGVWQYVDNLACQWRLPFTSDALSAYARGYFSTEQFEYIVKANADCLPWQNLLLEARRNRIGLQDAYRLYKLGQLEYDEFKKAWQRQGVDVSAELDIWQNAVQQYPGMSDLVRFMVRDIADQQVVDGLGLDQDFDNKWAGFLKQWGNAQGVQDGVAKAYWRAHWNAPSPQQIYQWRQRLRPDDRDPNDPNADLEVSDDDVQRLLQINDYIPSLIPFYQATSYRVIGRRDINRLIATGVFATVDDVRRAYRDAGLNARDADLLARATMDQQQPARAKYLGAMGDTEILRLYVQSTVTRDEATRLLTTAGYTQEQINNRLQTADIRKQSVSRGTMLKSLRQRYFLGEFTDGELQPLVQQVVQSADEASRLVAMWTAERESKHKHPSVAVLCKWFSQNLISIDDFMQRVRNLNYSEVDALNSVNSCVFGVREKQAKELERENIKQQQAQQRAARQAAQALKAQKQEARKNALLHKHTKRVVQRNKDGTFTTTTTDTFTNTVDPPVETSIQVDETVTTHKQ